MKGTLTSALLEKVQKRFCDEIDLEATLKLSRNTKRNYSGSLEYNFVAKPLSGSSIFGLSDKGSAEGESIKDRESKFQGHHFPDDVLQRKNETHASGNQLQTLLFESEAHSPQYLDATRSRDVSPPPSRSTKLPTTPSGSEFSTCREIPRAPRKTKRVLSYNVRPIPFSLDRTCQH